MFTITAQFKKLKLQVSNSKHSFYSGYLPSVAQRLSSSLYSQQFVCSAFTIESSSDMYPKNGLKTLFLFSHIFYQRLSRLQSLIDYLRKSYQIVVCIMLSFIVQSCAFIDSSIY